MEEGPDGGGQPLRRDCSCRGGSGFLHLSCFVAYAKQKSEKLVGKRVAINKFIGRGFGRLEKPWLVCLTCKQPYQNELAVDLANAFASFVQTKCPGDQRAQLRTLPLKLDALQNMGAMEEAKEICNETLSMVDQMKMQDNSQPRGVLKIEAGAYNILGRIAFEGGTE